jgi:fluoroquinolone transport system ATP-binding protein
VDEVIVRVEDLRYTYPRRDAPAVDGMGFEVHGGEVLGFLGPSGAGKTTAQRILIGLLHGWTGRVEVLGREPRRWGTELYDRIGVAFELPVGYPRLTGREELSHFAHLHAGPTLDVGELLTSLGLHEAADQPVGSYSKGMRVRLNLARAFLHEPELLFLDEPTSGLDPGNAAVVRDHIREQRRRGRTVFLTTHDMRTAEQVCDRVAFVVDGRIVACDAPRVLRLRHGRAELRVEHRTAEGVATTTFPLDHASSELTALLASGRVETVHTTEASLDEVFVALTGRRL